MKTTVVYIQYILVDKVERHCTHWEKTDFHFLWERVLNKQLYKTHYSFNLKMHIGVHSVWEGCDLFGFQFLGTHFNTWLFSSLR